MGIEIEQLIIPLIMAAGIPTAMTGFCFWWIERKIQKRDEKEKEERTKRQQELDEKEKAREELQLVVIQSVNASIALSEATAKAIQRVPDFKCNGDMHAALDYATKVKHDQRAFLARQGLKNIIE